MINRYKKYRVYLDWFDNRELYLDLKRKSIKGGMSTSASQFIRFGLNLIATFVLARILLPGDFGLIGMVTAFTGFASIIQDMGLSMAVIQKEKVTHRQVSNLFWINILICVLIALLFVILSPLIVALYHHDVRIYPIIISYAAGIAISGLSIQHNALMNRRMLFAAIAKANVYSTLLSVLLAIAAAIMGWGYWAIVILNLSAIILNTIFLWIYCNWRPSLPAKKHPIRDFLHFGAGISGFNIVNYITRYSDNVLIGSRIGATALGYYTKAYQLLLLPLNQLRNPLMTVAIPAMSKLQHEPAKYINYYRKYVFLLAFFSMPLVVCLGLFSKELILIILGHQWIPSSQIFAILAILGFIDPVAGSSGLVMISTGQAKKFFIIGFITATVTISGFFIGIHWGVIGVCISFVIVTYLQLLPVLYFSFKGTPIKLKHFFIEISLPAIHSLAMGGILYGGKILLGNYLSPFYSFLLLGSIGLGFYYFGWKAYPEGRKKLFYIDDLFLMSLHKITKKRNGVNNADNDQESAYPMNAKQQSPQV